MPILPADMHDGFNLAAPPGFVGFDEQKPMRIYHRHLPHWRQDGATYAVTFRLGDALPQSKLQELKRHRERWEIANPESRDEAQWKAFAKNITAMTERWMDEGYGVCHFRVPSNAELVGNALRFYEDTKCSVPCFTVMPNHIHAIMKPRAGFELETVLKTIKGWLSRQINQRTSNSPSQRNAGASVHNSPNSSQGLWAQESYDRIIRDEEHLYRVVQYIGRNGSAVGLYKNEYVRWMCPEWQAAGWGFRDE